MTAYPTEQMTARNRAPRNRRVLPALLVVCAAAVTLTMQAAFSRDVTAASATLDANALASGRAAWDAQAALQTAYTYAAEGLSGTAHFSCDLHTGSFVATYDAGPANRADGFDGTQAWMKDISGAVTPQAGGDKKQLAVNEAYRNAHLWWRADRGGATIRALGRKVDRGFAEDALEITPRGGKPFEARFDAASHLLRRIIEQRGFSTVTTWYRDYRPVEGALIAHAVTVNEGADGVQIETLAHVRFLPAADVATYVAPRPLPNDFAIAGNATSSTSPFRFLNNHVYVEVKVNGKGPFRFIVDSGGYDILTPDTARRLGLKVEGQAQAGGAAQAAVQSAYAKVDSLELGQATLRKQTVRVLAFQPAGTEGLEVDGVLGFEWLRRWAVRIDYGTHTLTSTTFATFNPAQAGTAVPFAFYNQLPQVLGAFEGLPGAFDIDTGSRVELTLTRPFVETNELRSKHPRGVVAVDGWGLGGRSRSYVTRAAEVRLGSVTIPDIVASFATQSGGSFSDANYAGNVGGGLLKRFVVTFDYAQEVLYLEPLPKPVADSGTFDRSGLWINAARDGFEVADVTAGGPGEEAGLKPGDRIVAVDGVSTKTLSLATLRMRFRDESAGTVVILTIARERANKTVSLTLRDQI